MKKYEIIKKIKNKSLQVENLNSIYKNDREIVLAAVQQDGSALYYASEELRNDKEIVFAAVTNNGYALQFASDMLQNDKEVVLKAVQSDGCALEYASENLKNDKKVVLIAVQQDSYALNLTSKELQNEIGENDPVKYLQSYFLQEKLNKNLINNLNHKNNNQAKIKKIKI